MVQGRSEKNLQGVKKGGGEIPERCSKRGRGQKGKDRKPGLHLYERGKKWEGRNEKEVRVSKGGIPGGRQKKGIALFFGPKEEGEN